MLKVILKEINKNVNITLALRVYAFFRYYFDYFEAFLAVFIIRFHKRTRRLVLPKHYFFEFQRVNRRIRLTYLHSCCRPIHIV